MTGNALEFQDLTKVYRTGFWLKRVTGIRGLSLEVHRGEVFGLLGANGAGKTTLFKLVAGLIRPTSGTGRILGEPLGSARARRLVGYLPENPAVHEFLTGRQFLQLVARLLGMGHREAGRAVSDALARVDLTAKRDLVVRKYSKGMVQKLALAQVMMMDHAVVVLDEPMSGLDPVGRRLVRDIILEFQSRGATVVFSSHVLSDAEALCNRVGLMFGGKLSDVGEVGALGSVGDEASEVVASAPPQSLVAELASRGFEARVRGAQAVFTAPGDAAVQELLALLLGHGVKVLGVQRQRESLEEYFVRRAGSGGTP